MCGDTFVFQHKRLDLGSPIVSTLSLFVFADLSSADAACPACSTRQARCELKEISSLGI